MTKIITENIREALSHTDRIFYILVASICICLFFYAFFIQKAVINVVNREDVMKESRLISSSITELEEKYFSLKNSVDLELAHAKGFKDAEITSFISLNPANAVVSRNEF